MEERNSVVCNGSCHCGAVTFKFSSIIEELTTCNCSLCKKKNALMLKVHEKDLQILSGESCLTEYQFHTRTARHFFCNTCGIYPFHRKRVTPDFFGVNVHCLIDFPLDEYPVRETNGIFME